MKTRLLCLLVLTMFLATHGTAQVLTGPITNPANQHNYYLLSPAFWTDAEAQAVSMGGHLVTINDAAENAWVLQTFGSYGGTSRTLEIGFTDQGHEGTWTWVSGESVTYVNWNTGEPNNGMGIYPYENVALMYGPGDPYPAGTWNDYMGTLAGQNYYGVVEVVPEPSILALLALAAAPLLLRKSSANLHS